MAVNIDAGIGFELARTWPLTAVVAGVAVIVPAPVPVQECLAFAVAALAYGVRRR